MRILHLFHQSLTELLKLILPNQVVNKKLSAYETENLQSAIQTTWVFFMLFIMVFAVGLCVLTFMGLEFESSLIVTLSSLTNTGPAYNLFTSDSLEYRVFREPVQIVLCFLMILGRIETLVLIAFLNPYHWMKFK
jgi:trk system potassium uptake protein TrkH